MADHQHIQKQKTYTPKSGGFDRDNQRFSQTQGDGHMHRKYTHERSGAGLPKIDEENNLDNTFGRTESNADLYYRSRTAQGAALDGLDGLDADPITETVSRSKDRRPYKKPLAEQVHEQESKRYKESLNKMHERVDHYDEHFDYKKKTKIPDYGNTRPDKYEHLMEENMTLKKTQNELETDVRKIATKLQHQLENLKRDKIVGGAQRSSITKQFETDLDQLVEENIKLQQEEEVLMQKVTKKKNKKQADLRAAGKTLYDVHESSTSALNKQTKMELEQNKIMRPLRAEVARTQKTIVQLRSEVESTRRLGDFDSSYSDLLDQRRGAENAMLTLDRRVKDLRSALQHKTSIIGQEERYEKDLNDELKGLENEVIELRRQEGVQSKALFDVGEVDSEIEAKRKERGELKIQHDQLLKTPFFQDDCGDKVKLLTELQKKIEKYKTAIKEKKDSVQKHVTEKAALKEDMRKMQVEKDSYKGDLYKLQHHIDPSQLSLDEVMRKLQTEDPSSFRGIMEDLKYTGKEPNWHKMDFASHMSIIREQHEYGTGEKSIETKKKLLAKLQLEKQNVATELNKAQNLLKLQVDIDKQTQAMNQGELDQLTDSIRQNNKQIRDLTDLLKVRNQNLQSAYEDERDKGKGLTADNLKKLDMNIDDIRADRRRLEQESMSYSGFEEPSEEQQLRDLENIMDFKIKSVKFDREAINTLGRNITNHEFQSFLAIDFFNHESIVTDPADTYDPDYEHYLFNFKNTVDTFYLRFLEKDFLIVDVFMIERRAPEKPDPSQALQLSTQPRPVKLGTAKLPLIKVFMGDKSIQTQEVVRDIGGQSIPMGTIRYQMQMRNSIVQDVEYYRRTKDKNFARGRVEEMGPIDKKVVEIQVSRAEGLEMPEGNRVCEMQPFFSYGFYTFEATSATVHGRNAVFNDDRKFEIENRPDFRSYLDKQLLKIDLIDESVPLEDVGGRDYIGTVSIPLKCLNQGQQIDRKFPVKDEQDNTNGYLSVKITIKDQTIHKLGDPGFGDEFSVKQTSNIQRSIVQKIMNGLAESELDSFEAIIDMITVQNDRHESRVTRKQLVDFFLNDMQVRGVSAQELTVLFKTHEVLSLREVYTKAELKRVFEEAYIRAREDLIDRVNLAPRHTSYGMDLNQIQQRDRTFRDPKEEPERQDDVRRNMFDETLAGGRSTMGETRKRREVSSEDVEKIFHTDLYDIIKAFESVAGRNNSGVNESDTIKILKRFNIGAPEALNFFNTNAMGDLLFFREVLMDLYGQKPKRQDFSNKLIPPQERQKLQQIKTKLKDALIRQHITLDDLFAIGDRNKDKVLSIKEFINLFAPKYMTVDEATLLFKAIDIDQSDDVTIEEARMELAAVNAGIVMREIAHTMERSKQTPQDLYQQVVRNDHGHMHVDEFDTLVQRAYQKCGRHEIEIIFHTMDKQGKGHIEYEDLKNALSQKDLKMKELGTIEVRDIIIPFVTRVTRHLRLSTGDLWAHHAKDGRVIRFEDFRAMIKRILGFTLSAEEEDMLLEYLRGISKNSDGSLEKVGLERLIADNSKLGLNMNNDPREASKTMKRIHQTERLKGRKLMQELENYQSETDKSRGEISVWQMKIMLFGIFNLSHHESQNLMVKWDDNQDGFIPITRIDSEVEQR